MDLWRIRGNGLLKWNRSNYGLFHTTPIISAPYAGDTMEQVLFLCYVSIDNENNGGKINSKLEGLK